MATQFSPEIDQIITGHTHDPYICSIPDPAGNPRLVTSSAAQGMTVTEANLVVDIATGEVDRGLSTATNHIVAADPGRRPDPDRRSSQSGTRWPVP